MWNPCQSCVCDRKADTKSWVHRSRAFFFLKTLQSVSGRLYRFLSQSLSSVGWPRHIHAMENCIWFSEDGGWAPTWLFRWGTWRFTSGFGEFWDILFSGKPIYWIPILNPNILGVSNQYWILLQDTSDESSVFSKNKLHDCSEKNRREFPAG